MAFQTCVFERISGYFKPHCKSKLRWLFRKFLREDERLLKLKNKILRLFLLLHCFCIEERNTDIQIKKYHLCDKHNILDLIQSTKKGSNKIHCIRNRIAFSVRVWSLRHESWQDSKIEEKFRLRSRIVLNRLVIQALLPYISADNVSVRHYFFSARYLGPRPSASALGPRPSTSALGQVDLGPRPKKPRPSA